MTFHRSTTERCIWLIVRHDIITHNIGTHWNSSIRLVHSNGFLMCADHSIQCITIDNSVADSRRLEEHYGI